MGLRRAGPVDDVAIAERRLAVALSAATRPEPEERLLRPAGQPEPAALPRAGWTPAGAVPYGAGPLAVRVLSGPVPRLTGPSAEPPDDARPSVPVAARGGLVRETVGSPRPGDRLPPRPAAPTPPPHDPGALAPTVEPPSAADVTGAGVAGADLAPTLQLGPRSAPRERRGRRRRRGTALPALADRVPVSWRAAFAASDEDDPRPRWRLDRPQVLVLLALCLGGLVLAGVVLLGGRSAELVVPMARAAPSQPAGAVASTQPSTAAPSPAAPSPADSSSADVVVHVTGLVTTPGPVQLPAGARVDDALRAAGGAQPGVDLGGLNLARPVLDGEQIAVGVPAAPDAGGSPAGGTGAGGAAGSPAGTGGVVDLNRATLADLDALPGVGPVLAQRILDWRAEHGRFTSVDELQEVSGIGPST